MWCVTEACHVRQSGKLKDTQAQQPGAGSREQGAGSQARTLGLLNSIVALHLPVTSPMSLFPRRMRPWIALYVPEKYPCSPPPCIRRENKGECV